MKRIDGPTLELWNDLRSCGTRLPIGQFTAQELRIDGKRSGAFMALAHDDSLHVMIPVNGEPCSELPLHLTGLEVQERFVLLGQPEGRLFLDVSSSPAFEAMFTSVSLEIATLALCDGIEPRRAALQTIRRWRTFWKRPHGKDLTRGEQIGLYGELWFLDRLIAQLGPSVVNRWTGPNGERHDFQGDRCHIEVKVTEKDAPTFRISSLDQLDPPDGRALGLATLMVREEAMADDGLVRAMRRCEEQLRPHVAEHETFLQRLEAAGYRVEREADLDRLRLLVRSAEVYLVDEKFPRLSQESFRAGALPPGILRLEYDIDLSRNLAMGDSERDAFLLGLID